MGGLIDVRDQDHLHRFHHRPSRQRDNNSYHLPVAVTSSRDQREGFRRFGRRERGSDLASSSPVEENLFSAEPRRKSPSKGSGRLIRVLLEEEKSRETEIRHQTPSVIARLMGLDTIPLPQVIHKQQKATPMGFRKASPRMFQEDLSHQASTSEEEKFKDVFEVMESSKMEKHKKQPVWNHMPKKSEKEFNPGRQKFMDSARLPISDSPQNCDELNDYLESLDSGEELLPKFLQKPNSLPLRHLDDLKKCLPSAESSLITILRSTKHKKSGERDEVFRPERKTERYSHLPKDITSSRRRPMPNLDGHSLKEIDPYAHESKVKNRGIEDSCLSPTRIVVLKPSPEKAEGMLRNTSLQEPSKLYQFDFRRNQEFQLSGRQELRSEGKERRKYYEDPQVMNNKTKSSRELAREITEQIRLRHIREETSRVMTNNNSKLSEHTSNNLDHRNRNYHTSTSCASESSVSREARKRLSERWNMTHRFRETGHSGGGSGTLGEMLALSDTEKPRRSYTFVLNKDSAEKPARHDKLATQRRHSAELPRSTSLPLPTVSGNPKPRSRIEDSGSDSGDNCNMLKEMLNFEPNDSLHGYSVRRNSSRRRFKYGRDKPHQPSQATGEENIHPVREIHVIQPSNVSEESKSKLSAMSDRTNENVRYLSDNSLSSESLSVILGCISPEVQAQQQPMYVESSANGQIDISTKETSHVQPQEDIVSSPCDRKDSGSPIIFHVSEQPSPISVLEPETEEETYSSQCFEKISADLQSIRMQLQLLKLESEDNADDPQTVSDDETGRESVNSGANHQAFTNDEDRDFAYILDVLVSSGIHGINKDMLFSACYSPTHPIDQAVFEKLENKYGALVAWSESDRKLLFDHVNSILAEMFAPCMDLHPWANSKRKLGPAFPSQGLAEEVSRVVDKQRKALCIGNPEDKVLDTKWIETGDYVDMIGRDIERMLKEELLEELVSELIAENVSHV